MKKTLKMIFAWLAIIAVLTICGISISSFINYEKEISATPDPNDPLTLENACDYSNQVIEVEGKLLLQGQAICSTEEPYTCEMYLSDPLRVHGIFLDIPLSKGFSKPPVNHMAELPAEYSRNDFYIMTSENRYARDGSFVSVRGRTSGRGTNCRLINIESIKVLDRLVYMGVDLTRVTLQQALNEGLVIATIKGNGLTKVNITIKPKVELNLEIEVERGAMLISGTEGVQNMVVREQEFIYLKPNLEAEVNVELEVSCANMELDQPTYSDIFTISSEPTNEDLNRLLEIKDFSFLDLKIQQFAIWTITDNPPDSYSYTAIDEDGITFHPSPGEISEIKRLFEEVGIDTTKYIIFHN